MSKIAIFGERVALKKTEQKFEGKIWLPPARQKSYDIGEIVEKGEKSFLEKGEMVLFQVNDYVAQNTMVKVDGTTLLICHQNDIIARVTSQVLAWDKLAITGRRLLLEPWFDTMSDTIIVPTNAESNKELIRYRVSQKGNQVDLPVEIGQEVFPDRGRCFPLVIGSDARVYVDQECIQGIRLE